MCTFYAIWAAGFQQRLHRFLSYNVLRFLRVFSGFWRLLELRNLWKLFCPITGAPPQWALKTAITLLFQEKHSFFCVFCQKTTIKMVPRPYLQISIHFFNQGVHHSETWPSMWEVDQVCEKIQPPILFYFLEVLGHGEQLPNFLFDIEYHSHPSQFFFSLLGKMSCGKVMNNYRILLRPRGGRMHCTIASDLKILYHFGQFSRPCYALHACRNFDFGTWGKWLLHRLFFSR